MIHLKGHTAFITGSSKGVGQSIAVAFAEAGANLVLHGRNDANETIERCKKFGVKISFVPADLLAPTEQVVPDLLKAVLAADPNVDILINNAGQFFDTDYLEMTQERFDKTMRLNVAVPYFLTQAFSKHWIANKVNGRVLMIGSINGRLAEPGSTAYDTSKGALEMMMRTITVALAPHNIRVNGMAPGLVKTPQTSWIDKRPDKAAWMKLHTPNGQVPHSDVCGGAAVYMVSDCADHLHGQMLIVDGGMSAWQQPNMPKGFNSPAGS
jgi:glucose 1-dehydrogenase